MKKISWLILIGVLIAFATYLYVFHKPHRDIANEEAKYQLSAQQLVSEYKSDRSLADSMYLDQIVALKGVLSAKENGAFNLESGIYVKLDSNATDPVQNIGDSLAVQGRVVSYDDLFEEVRLDFAKVLP